MQQGRRSRDIVEIIRHFEGNGSDYGFSRKGTGREKSCAGDDR
jgi:hypothetical protein